MTGSKPQKGNSDQTGIEPDVESSDETEIHSTMKSDASGGPETGAEMPGLTDSKLINTLSEGLGGLVTLSFGQASESISGQSASPQDETEPLHTTESAKKEGVIADQFATMLLNLGKGFGAEFDDLILSFVNGDHPAKPDASKNGHQPDEVPPQ